jgi:DnaK suppressor protein
LEHQRDFRREQLAQVDLHQPTRRWSGTDGAADCDEDAALALREIEALVTAGARRALADIELALARMRTGHYGYCRICDTGIPLVVLEAIPKTTLCLACQRFSEHTEDRPSAADSIPPSAIASPREAPTGSGRHDTTLFHRPRR